MDFTVWCIQGAGTLDVLAKTIWSASHRHDKLPSWVIDWSDPTPPRNHSPLLRKSAELPTTATHQAQTSYFPASSAILLKGYVFDQLATCAHTVYTEEMQPPEPAIFRGWQTLALESGNDPYHGRSHCFRLYTGRQQAFWRAIFTDAQTTNTWTDFTAYPVATTPASDWKIADLEYWAKNGDFLDNENRSILAKYHKKKRQMFITRNGHIGLSSEVLSPGDLVCIFFGARLPFIIRRCAKQVNLTSENTPPNSASQAYQLVDGDVYVEGLGIDGAGIEICQEQGLESTEICLV